MLTRTRNLPEMFTKVRILNWRSRGCRVKRRARRSTYDNQNVADGGCEEEKSADDRLHRWRRLCVRELETGDREQDFGGSENGDLRHLKASDRERKMRDLSPAAWR